MPGVPVDSGKNGISDHEMEGSDADSNAGNSVSSDSDSRGNVEAFEFDEQRALRGVAKFVCRADVPFNMVLDDGFPKLTNNPLFKPTSDAVERKCMEFYEERKAETKEILGNLGGRISLSVDILRNDESYISDDYLCLSAHFIDENWKVKKLVLYYRSLFNSGSSEDEDWGIYRCLEDWGIETKISTLTVTNAHRYDDLIEFVKTRIQEKEEFQLNGKLFRVYCCEEIISKMVQDAFSEIEEVIFKFRRVMSFNLVYPLWYLTNSKLKEALDWRSKGEFSPENGIDPKDVPSPEEWKEVEAVHKIVESIYEVSYELFETKNLTANVYLYHLHELREILAEKFTDSDILARLIAKDMLEVFDKYWDDMFVLLAVAAVLDPRFKMKYINFVCLKEDPGGSLKVSAVWESLYELFDNYVIPFPENENVMCDSSSSNSDSEMESPLPAERVSHTFRVLQDYQQFLESNNQPKSELHCYLEEPVLPCTQDFNALVWWRTAGATYPTLSRMARDFLAIPVSLGSSFEAFFTEPKPADDLLIGLKPDLMNALKCTRSWSHSH